MDKNPTDRGKIGTKRSVLTEGGGVPIGLAVEGANRNDFKMARETIESIPIARPAPTPDNPQGMCLDTGCDYDEVHDLLAAFGFPPTSARGGKRPKPCSRKLGAGPAGGRWSRASTAS